MSRIEKLIKEKCQNGAEYKSIGEICTIVKGVQLNKDSLEDNGLYPVINGGINPSGYWNEYNFGANLITISQGGASAGYVNFIDTPFWAGAHCYVIRECVDSVLYRYLYHFMKMNQINLMQNQIGAGIPSVSLKTINKLEIPVPPIEVQQEIVCVLDKFTELEAELQAELDARKKQYEYYRDELLSFDDTVDTYKMGEVLTFLNGRAYKQEELLNDGKYPVLRVGNFYTNDSWYYSDLELDDNKYCEKGDLLYSWAATLGPKIWDGNKCIYHYHIWKIVFDDTRIDKEYLYYYLQYDLSNIARSTTNSTMIHVSMGSMKERMISIPPIEKQKQIVSILNKFEVLCKDAKQGLSAEIEARRKQYEYYRDKLLSFERFGE